jgi:predicted pyridoxine 5'-phosphate oxidase superfamily flavin-nucleotide-binding protein
MSRLYGPNHRALQDRFDTRRLADGVERRVVETEVSAEHRRFIESRDMFWLATVDHRGRPTVSYKGGDPGFVRVLDAKTLAYPSYDGNGMYISMGNIAGNAEVGLLFIDFERPYRLRVQGTATIDDGDSLLGEMFEAQLVVRVAVSEVFRNCPRYVHKYQKVHGSKYVPREGVATPLAGWKKVDDVQADLPARDRGRAEGEGGLRTREQHSALVAAGDPDA